MLTCRSGKPEKSAAKDFLNSSRVFPAPSVRFAARYLPVAARLRLSKNFVYK